MGNCCPTNQFTEEPPVSALHFSRDIREQLQGVDFDQESGFKSKEEVLADYNIVKQVGSGLFSRVYLATDKDGRRCAIKMIKKKHFATRETIQKILVEKEILRIIDHENVLKLYKTMQTHSRIYFVLEYSPKGNLLNVLNIKKRLTVDEIRVIAAQIIEALLYMHSKGIIYGDLKAENILLDENGAVKLCDFNLSGTRSLLNDTLQGTVCYLAPEIIEGRSRTPKSDFWSLGVLVYLLYYRKYPFKNNNQTELFFNILNRNIELDTKDNKAPLSFRQFILDLMTKDYRKRIGNNAAEFAKHPFFRSFDWQHFREDPRYFTYIEDIPSIEDRVTKRGKGTSDDELQTLKETQTNKFVYNIPDFTYEDKNNLTVKQEVNDQPRTSSFQYESFGENSNANVSEVISGHINLEVGNREMDKYASDVQKKGDKEDEDGDDVGKKQQSNDI